MLKANIGYFLIAIHHSSGVVSPLHTKDDTFSKDVTVNREGSYFGHPDVRARRAGIIIPALSVST